MKNLNEKIDYTVETLISDIPMFDVPTGVVFDKEHYYLMVDHHDWRSKIKNPAPESLSIYKLDQNLHLIRSINISPYIKNLKNKYPKISLDNFSEPILYKNQIIVAGNFSNWRVLNASDIKRGGGAFITR